MRNPSLPLARNDGLITKKTGDEILIYDIEQHKAHCLNEMAGLMWEHCDGKTTINQLASLLTLNENVGKEELEQIVILALDQLKKSNLLNEAFNPPKMTHRISRRQLVKAAGIALVALPVISTLIAPNVADAQCCIPDGNKCSDSRQCCSGLCRSSIC